jgi:hypothetical protein
MELDGSGVESTVERRKSGGVGRWVVEVESGEIFGEVELSQEWQADFRRHRRIATHAPGAENYRPALLLTSGFVSAFAGWLMLG